MSDSVIVRRRIHRNFTTLDNVLIRDVRLSWKALGLLVFLLSLPPNFKLHLVYLSKLRRSGRDATRSGLKELEDVGYLLIERRHDALGRFSATIWHVSDLPDGAGFSVPKPCAGNPNAVSPDVDSPCAASPMLINTDNKQRLKAKRTTTKTLGDVGELVFPVGLSSVDCESVRAALVSVPAHDAQALLDELGMVLRTGVIKTTPIRWLGGVLKRYNSGQFVATKSSVHACPVKTADALVAASGGGGRNIGAKALSEIMSQLASARR
ncbi:MAG: hypothetical protein WAW12_02285 [Pseudomonas sp.]